MLATPNATMVSALCIMIAAPPKSNYSKPELFDYFIPLEKSIFTNKGSYCYKQCQKKL
jgi:hypothetical protein